MRQRFFFLAFSEAVLAATSGDGCGVGVARAVAGVLTGVDEAAVAEATVRAGLTVGTAATTVGEPDATGRGVMTTAGTLRAGGGSRGCRRNDRRHAGRRDR